MEAGRLDRRVTIQAHASKLDGAGTGQDVGIWTDVATVWAQKDELRGSESFASAQRFAEVTTRFRIRWRRDVTPASRLVCEGRTYDVLEVLEVGRREGLDLMAIARAE